MIGRALWFAALAGIALLTAGLQLDVHSGSAPGMAPLVPTPLRNFAQVEVTARALRGTDTAAALAEAERLVHRRPAPAEYLALLALAQARAGQEAAAGRTIQIAGQRGWRELATQEAVLRLALAAGDKPEAARRYVALFLNQRTPNPLLEALGPAVLDEPGGLGQRTMVAMIVGGERWHSTFLRRGALVMPPAAFSTIAAEAMARNAAFDCGVLGQAVATLDQRDKDAAARLSEAAARRCPGPDPS
jgi:hypothetical protein